MDHVLGQPRAVEQLQAQLASGRVHHAQLFFGPAGTGKFTTAVAFARVRLCHQPRTDLTGRVAACGTCGSCVLFGGGGGDADGDTRAVLATGHPDLHVVNKERAAFHDDKKIRDKKQTTIPVEVLRDALLGPAFLSPQLNHGKVFVVDEAHLLRGEGQNALLKVLEEPPVGGGGTTIVLITDREDALLPTIRSRCQRTPFVALPGGVVADWLDRRSPGLTPADRDWLLGFAAGSLGRAELAVQHDLAEWGRAVLPGLTNLAAGRAEGGLGPALENRIKAFAEAWVKAHKQASKEAANKRAARLMFSLITGHAQRQLAAAAAGGDPAGAAAPWLAAIDAVSVAEARLAANVHLGLLCDGLVSDLARALTGRGAYAA